MGKKHGANNREDYRHIFEAALDKLAEGGFLFGVNLTFTPIPGAIEIRGTLECPGRIFIKVENLLALYGGEENDPLVRTETYSYNAYVNGIGNILRYDGPDHHRPYHHVHRYDILSGDTEGSIERIGDDEWPHLSEVVEEVVYWYWENMRAVDALKS